MAELDDLLIGLGLDERVELCRLDRKNGAAFLFLPQQIRDRLALTSERYLVAFVEGEILVLIKDTQLAERLRPVILARRQQAVRVRNALKVIT